MDNVEQTIISQYGNSSIIGQLIDGMNTNIRPDADIDNFYDTIFNVDTANLFGLSIWSRIVGIPQELIVALGSYLSDEATFRSLILLKALSNILYASSPSINRLLQNWLGAGSRAYVVDTGSMTMLYQFEFALTAAQIQIIQNSGIFLRPAGVLSNIVQITQPFIGFAEMGLPWVTTMGNGVFFEDFEMQLSGAPAKIVEPFAVNAAPSGGYGGKRTVPVPSQISITPGAASFNDGFPPLTMTPLPGGVVMSGLDMNGALNQISAPVVWANAGGVFPYDGTFSTAVGGYPKVRVLNAAGTGLWISIVDNNVTNPNTGGAGWIPDRAVASVYASAQQTVASGNTKLLWDTVEVDAFGLWNSGSKVFQALWAGNYRLSGAVYFPSAAGQNIAVMAYKNGSLARQCCQFPQVSDVALTYPFDVIIPCAVADQLAVFLNLTSSTLAGQSGSNQAYVYGQIEFLGV